MNGIAEKAFDSNLKMGISNFRRQKALRVPAGKRVHLPYSLAAKREWREEDKERQAWDG
jgi:hypothetical protein